MRLILQVGMWLEFRIPTRSKLPIRGTLHTKADHYGWLVRNRIDRSGSSGRSNVMHHILILKARKPRYEDEMDCARRPVALLSDDDFRLGACRTPTSPRRGCNTPRGEMNATTSRHPARSKARLSRRSRSASGRLSSPRRSLARDSCSATTGTIASCLACFSAASVRAKSPRLPARAGSHSACHAG